jgi:hypothetical protein
MERLLPVIWKLAERLFISLVDRLAADSSIEAHSGRRK